jgi:hypothetical protein
MKRFIQLGIIIALCAAPAVWAQDISEDHAEVGVFADYFRLSATTPEENFLGLGGRAAVNVQPWIQIEGEMAYDFQRNYTSTYSNTITSTTVTSHLRTLHGFFGPKFQTGSGPVRFFVTGKVGFDNFSVTNATPPAGFTKAVALTSGTQFAVYPGGGIEAFAGPIGIRAEVGDDIYFLNGAHNNLRASLGPQFRF